MNYYEELRKTEKQIARKKFLMPTIKMLKDRKYELEQKVYELGQKKLAEDKDVEKIEGYSLARFFYGVVGKRDEMLTKERQEAYEATVKYDAAMAELKALEQDIKQKEDELALYLNAEKRYDEALRNYTKAVAEGNISDCDFESKDGLKPSAINEKNVEEVATYQKQLTFFDEQLKEVKEAKLAAGAALATAEKIKKSLESAENWGVYDTFFNGGLMANIAKHSHINDAEADVWQLQQHLTRLEAEMKDISFDCNIAPVTTDFLKFADFFFDGIFVDYTVLGKIENSLSRTEDTWRQIKGAMNKLELAEKKIIAEQDEIKKKLAAILS